MTAPRNSGAVYELTVDGILGPALRAMVEPTARPHCVSYTVMRVRVRRDEDLVDVLDLISAEGLEFLTISAIP